MEFVINDYGFIIFDSKCLIWFFFFILLVENFLKMNWIFG